MIEKSFMRLIFGFQNFEKENSNLLSSDLYSKAHIADALNQIQWFNI